MWFTSLSHPDGTRQVWGQVWHPHTHTRSFSPPPPPIPRPTAEYRMPPDLHSAGFARPDGYQLGRALAMAQRCRIAGACSRRACARRGQATALRERRRMVGAAPCVRGRAVGVCRSGATRRGAGGVRGETARGSSRCCMAAEGGACDGRLRELRATSGVTMGSGSGIWGLLGFTSYTDIWGPLVLPGLRVCGCGFGTSIPASARPGGYDL
jgi:hypothetical protein